MPRSQLHFAPSEQGERVFQLRVDRTTDVLPKPFGKELADKHLRMVREVVQEWARETQIQQGAASSKDKSKK